jgi:hypothetical protein
VSHQAVGDDTHVIEHETVDRRAGRTSLDSQAQHHKDNRAAPALAPRADSLEVARHELRFPREEDPQQQRLLARLREAGDQPVAFAELHTAGIDFPAAVVSELQLNGFAIDRVYDRARLVGVRLLEVEPSHAAAPRRRRLRPWRQR